MMWKLEERLQREIKACNIFSGGEESPVSLTFDLYRKNIVRYVQF